MEIINNTPFAVEALPFNCGPEGKPILTIIVKGTFSINADASATFEEEQIPIAFGDELYEDSDSVSVKYESDIVPFKPRADIVLVGKAYAPGGRAVGGLDVALRVGSLSRVIRVFGDRKWIFGSGLMPVDMSKAVPFTSMDLTYERAFGGIDLNEGGFCEENLVGRGFIGEKQKKESGDVLLPNLEDPKNLIKSWKDRPKPVGFGFYGRAWMPRVKYMGTYDEKWRKERSPDPPEDFRFDYYNAAHPDLQVNGYLKGDEEVRLVNLSPNGESRFRLPGITPSVTVIKSDEFGEEILEEDELKEEITMNLDTLCLIPDRLVFYQVWRGICHIDDLTSSEIKEIEVTWFERL
jgi:hypothetical protein